MLESSMDDLIVTAWDEYGRFVGNPSLVAASMPILYFGDSSQYLASAYRVVTVGLNPSRVEFPAPAPTSRFAGITALPDAFPDGITSTEYRQALDAYFRTNPYHWFRCFRDVLSGLHTSYDDTEPNHALHTDLCSPLATDPTWSGLSWQAQQRLMSGGIELWHRLISYLRPHVIILSVRDQYRWAVRFQDLDEWRILLEIGQKKDGSSRKKPYRVLVKPVVVTQQDSALLVYAPAAQTPFGSISSEQKTHIGHMIEEHQRES